MKKVLFIFFLLVTTPTFSEISKLNSEFWGELYQILPSGTGKLYDPGAVKGKQFTLKFNDLPKDLGNVEANERRFQYDNPEPRPFPVYFYINDKYDVKFMKLYHQ